MTRKTTQASMAPISPLLRAFFFSVAKMVGVGTAVEVVGVVIGDGCPVGAVVLGRGMRDLGVGCGFFEGGFMGVVLCFLSAGGGRWEVGTSVDFSVGVVFFPLGVSLIIGCGFVSRSGLVPSRQGLVFWVGVSRFSGQMQSSRGKCTPSLGGNLPPRPRER